MPTHILTFKPACQGQARKQTKLQIACKKAFSLLKQPISAIKRGCSPLNTGVSSYEIDSDSRTTEVRDSASVITTQYDAADRLSRIKYIKAQGFVSIGKG